MPCRASLVSGAALPRYASADFRAALQAAPGEAKSLKDQFVSTEHLLLALLKDRKAPVGEYFASIGVTRERVLQAINDLRGGENVVDANPESKMQALEKFTVDLTDAAGATFTVEWLNINADKPVTGKPVAGGAVRTFTTPFPGPAALLLKRM